MSLLTLTKISDFQKMKAWIKYFRYVFMKEIHKNDCCHEISLKFTDQRVIGVFIRYHILQTNCK